MREVGCLRMEQRLRACLTMAGGNRVKIGVLGRQGPSKGLPLEKLRATQ
jgi:hypothetical protein